MHPLYIYAPFVYPPIHVPLNVYIMVVVVLYSSILVHGVRTKRLQYTLFFIQAALVNKQLNAVQGRWNTCARANYMCTPV